MNQIPQAGEIYQHFKGKLYRIVTLATHTETCLLYTSPSPRDCS